MPIADLEMMETLSAPRSLTELRRTHERLLREYSRRRSSDTLESNARKRKEVREFIAAIHEIGIYLSAFEDRLEAQQFLEYWSATLISLDETPAHRLIALYDPSVVSPLRTGVEPYVGMNAFTEKQSDFFFGRNELIEKIVSRLKEHRFVAILGDSGSGKSSLVRAGFLPRLEKREIRLRDRDASYCYFTIAPGAEPLKSLWKELGEKIKGLPADIPETMFTTPGSLHALLEEKGITSAVFFVDQFEELFTLSLRPDKQNSKSGVLRASNEQEGFIDNLLFLVSETDGDFYFLLTMRSDFVKSAAQIDALWRRITESKMSVAPMNEEELREAIERPATLVGLEFDRGVVDDLVTETLGNPVGLPLLQFTLKKLWKAKEGNRITRNAYLASGGVRVSIGQSAQALYDSLSKADQIIVDKILLRIVRPGTDFTTTSSRVRFEVVYRHSEEHDEENVTATIRQTDLLVNKLQKAGLVRITRNSIRDTRPTPGHYDPNDQIEIAHEALIYSWPALQLKIERHRLEITRRFEYERRLAEWKNQKDEAQKKQALMPRYKCEEVRDWVNSLEAKELGYDPELDVYIEKSWAALEEVDRQERAQRERENAEQHLRIRVEAETQRRVEVEAMVQIAKSNQLAARAQEVGRSALDLGLLLGLQAYETNATPEAKNAVLALLGHNPYLQTYLRGHCDMVYGVALSSHNVLASTDRNGDVFLWDISVPSACKRLDYSFKVDGYMMGSLAFSPDGRLLAGGCRNGDIYIWSIEKQSLTHKIVQDGNCLIWSLSFSPSGKTLVVGSENSGVQLWDVESGKALKEQPHFPIKDSVLSVAFSQDGRLLVWGGTEQDADGNKVATLWSMERHECAARLSCSAEDIISIAINRESTLLAAACKDGSIWMWNISDADQPHRYPLPLLAHTAMVWQLVFNPSGTILASAGQDNSIVLWDTRTRQRIGQPLMGHSDGVNSLAFSSDGKTLVSGGDDKNVILWDMTARLPFREHSEIIYRIIVSPDGTRWASCDLNREVLIWDEADLRVVRRMILPDEFGFAVGLAFSPNSNLLAAGTKKGTVVVWDMNREQNEPILSFTAVELRDKGKEPVEQGLNARRTLFCAAFHQDGNLLATGSENGTIRLWDVASGSLRGVSKSHDGIIYALAFSGDTLASGGYDGKVCIFDLRPQAKQDKKSRLDSLVGRVEGEYPNGLRLANTFKGHLGAVSGIAFHPVYRNLLVTVGEDCTIRAWNIDEATPTSLLLGRHESGITSVAFDKEGVRMVTGGRDRTVTLWNLSRDILQQHSTVRQLLSSNRMRGHLGIVNGVAFSGKGNTVISVGDDRTLMVWKLGLSDWQKHACQVANRNLTKAEWDFFIGPDRAYQSTCPDL